MSRDPAEIVANSPMSCMQITVVAIVIALNALDGFDILAISFAAPGIATEWGIDRAELGIVLSMELIGMALGSVLLGNVADRTGRRSTILGCLLVMTFGMYMVTTASGLAELSLWRLLTGLGIGGMLAAINAVTAEFANARRKHLCVSLMAIGYPLGAVLGGAIAAQLLKVYDWRAVFYLGTGITAVFIPLVYFLVPESLHWLAQKQPRMALEKINATLRRMQHAGIDALPEIGPELQGRSAADIFSPALLLTTVVVTTAYFFHIMTFYFVLKWIPKIVVDMGFAASSAATVLVWANVGGAAGGASLGILSLRYRVKTLTIAVFLLSAVMVILFGRSAADLQHLSVLCALTGFCTNAGVVGMYVIFAHAYPTHARAFGTGFAIGVGRGGAVLAPIAAGFLFSAGVGMSVVAMIMAAGSLCAALVLASLRIPRASNVQP